MNNERDFKGVWIPKEIWLDARLNMLEKGILAEIDSLDNDDGCSAGNEYLASFCQCSETKVSTAIKKLIELGYIYQQSFNGRVRILKSRLSNFERQTFKNLKADFNNFKAINKDNNKNKLINYKYIVGYLNDKTGCSYKPTTPKTQTLIRARFNEGFTEDDFKKVIDNKVKDWKGTEWEQYLRPETLFGTKFENYLNTKETPKRQNSTNYERKYTKEELDSFFTDIDEIKL